MRKVGLFLFLLMSFYLILGGISQPQRHFFVEREVCKASGLLATEWCPPEYVELKLFEYRKDFPRGWCPHHSEPANVCNFPVTEINRIVAWDGHAYTSLFMLWQPEVGFSFELWDYLADEMSKYVNAERFFAIYTEGDWWRQYGVMPFKKVSGGKYDLEELSEEYVGMLHQRLGSLHKRKITTIVCLLAGIKQFRFLSSPFNGIWNVNGTATHSDDFLTDPETVRLTKKYFRMMVEEFDNKYIIWEFMNEPPYDAGEQDTWYTEMVEYMHGELGIPYERLHIEYWNLGSNIYKYLDWGLWAASHSVNSLTTVKRFRQSASRWEKYRHGKCYLSGDGWDEFEEARGLVRGDQRELEQWWKRKASAVQMREMIDYDLHTAKEGIYGNGIEFMTSAPFALHTGEVPNLDDSLRIGLYGLTLEEARLCEVDPNEYLMGELIQISLGHREYFPQGEGDGKTRSE